MGDIGPSVWEALQPLAFEGHETTDHMRARHTRRRITLPRRAWICLQGIHEVTRPTPAIANEAGLESYSWRVAVLRQRVAWISRLRIGPVLGMRNLRRVEREWHKKAVLGVLLRGRPRRLPVVAESPDDVAVRDHVTSIHALVTCEVAGVVPIRASVAGESPDDVAQTKVVLALMRVGALLVVADRIGDVRD
jgi:hypothetical protein